ncbi:MAG: hypothetical protein COX62_00915 [Deltaproteobacteria bacterium CG_4_10_14_0_2_um_filter_43_8]|nr:MAG: hypothetical protein COV43_06880 [Deltaproteobacteria bacterium CG11_big_fil_rev_8_21_14_0_20_42_23]PJA22014.1 MAG: hypothetical protein COX62_00915 [Deltaproteobacteria bacterium CG_4_10_14_0_2_um_filter_43_8]PJC65239.1 MAG: hypothetical protein CO021_00185 [Deltaproteobacteria bacterium CG_4_9_14_0_2_um_filter_42_21]
MTDFSSFIKALEQGNTFLVGSHASPDGDAIGSSLAFMHALRQLGKKCFIYNRDGVPDNLHFLPGSEQVLQTVPHENEYDSIVVLDCARFNRVGGEFNTLPQTKLTFCVDHHHVDGTDAKHEIVLPDAASTGEILASLFEAMRIELTPEMAQCLYCTLVVDTGFFRHSNTTAQVMRLAARLLEAGASAVRVSEELDASHPESRFHLLAASLSSLNINHQYHYATMEVTQEMLRKTCAHMELAEEFSHYPRSVKGVQVSMLFREMEDGKIRVSLRSGEGIDISNLAKHFNGGGHVHAAGCTFTCSLEEAKKQLEEYLVKHLKDMEQ